MAQSITREAALRVGLAARELGNLSARELVSALVERLDLPLTEAKLATVTVADLQFLLQGDDVVETDVPRDNLKQAVRLLWGEGVVHSELPPLASYVEGDMPGSIRVACASNREQLLDGHYGSCERFLVYQVSPDEVRLIAVRPTLAADHAEDRNVARAALISDCQIVYVQSIGGPATAKVVRAGVHPVKVASRENSGIDAAQTLVQLQQALRHPPPWLARIMGVEAGSLARFAADLSAEDA
ncbi:MAG: dinitrogenase iron-molybdenum cofactor biosynthesis protein [Candidatus Accumulibacter sp. UW26]|jgi:nitrogen fixation protein NifX